MKRSLLLLSLVLSLCVLPGVSRALTLSAEPGADCFSSDASKCIGGVYSLDVAVVDANTYLATFTMDLGPGLEVPATTIEQIEFKVAGAYDSTSILLAPDAVSNWTLVDGPLGGAGCKGKNDSFVCLDANSPLGVSATTYTWQVQFDAAGLLAESDWHIGARFASPDHQNGWVLSASAAPIPEPSSYLLLGFGAAIVGLAIRRQTV
jgi:hypothetical protein